MAEELENFSPLDSLGPAYGKINRPALDVQGISPFEGDKIDQAPINFPRPQLHPVMPGMNITKPQQNVRQNVVGAPGKEPNKNGKASDLDVRRAHTDYISGVLQTSKPKDQFAKIYSYDAGPDGNAFYKRYMAYGKETFDKVGFSPLRDNEAVFNARTTIGDDWSRMMTHSFWPLFTSGFTSGPKSLMKMLSGDFTSGDLADARIYEEAAAIGQSSKGGFMGFMNNTVMNFGYTAGIISEAILEEAAGALLAPVTAGSSMWLTTANNLNKIKGVGAAVDAMSAIRKGISNMATVTGARRAWNAVHDLGTNTALGRFVNPLDNTFDALKADNLTGLAKLSKTAGGLYRDARGINMAVSEARLEAGMVENKVYDQLYKDYFSKNQDAPDNETQKEMMKKAKDASLDTFYKNAALIYASNKITFNNVMSPRGGIRNFIKSTVDDVATVGGGKFGNLGKIVYDNAKKSFSFEANNIKNLAKSWYKNPGFKTAAKTVGYFKANFTEGFQENAQEIIAGANERYYIDSFNSPARQAHEYSMSAANYSMKSQADYYLEEARKQNPLTAQGFETFASGFFMGMFAHPLNNAIPFLSAGYNRMFDKQAFEDYRTKKTEITKNLVDQLNNVKMDDFLKSRLFDYGAQDIIGRIKESGGKKEALDAENESLILSMLGSGVTDTFAEKVRSMNELDDKEFMDALNIDEEEIPAYRERVNYAADKMERVRKTHNYYQDKYPNPVNLESIKDMDKDSEEYNDLVALYHGWDLAVKNAVFFNETFEDTKQRMKDIEKKFLRSVNREKTGLRELGLLLTPSKMQQELQLLNKEVISLEALPKKDEATQKELTQKANLAKNIEKYLTSLAEFDNFFNRDQLYESAKAEVSKKLGREATKEEVETFVDNKIGKLDDEKKQTKILTGLKNAFSEYAKYVSESNDDFAFDDNLEKAFTLLTDHYKLGTEARQTAKYIDRLNNPAVMFEVAERNKAWMTNLYNRRKTYYTKMVKAQMKAVEGNTLLNKLADEGIFVDLNEFETWQRTGALPNQFFDNVNKRVFTPGTEEYSYLAMFFQQASELNDEEPVEPTAADEPVELITPTSVQDVEAALQNLNAKTLVAKGNVYVNADDSNDVYDRVSTMKGEFDGSLKAANRGTIIDDMLRGYINGTATTIEAVRKIYINHPLKDETQRFSDEFIRELFDIFGQVKEIADNRGLKLIANIPTLWGTINNKKYAGTIDLLGIDKSGQVYIIDLKTSSQERRSHYEMTQFIKDNAGNMFNSIMQKIKEEGKNNILGVKNFTEKEQKVIDQLVEKFKDNVNKNTNRLSLYDYSGADTIQLSAYAELIRQRTGITVKNMTIFPVQATIKDGAYIKAEPNKDADGKFTMAVDIDRSIFPEKAKAAPTPTETPVSADAKADIEKELFSETDNKGRTLTVFSTTKEKDGLIKTVFTFNRSDKDPSQRNKIITGIPVEKALGDKYTIDEEYIPEGAKVIGVSEIRISKTGAAASVTFEDSEGNTFQGEVVLNSNTSYDAELAALSTTDTKAEGTNARGTTYKGETTEKDGLKVTKYSEFFPDGKRISKGGRIMTPAEFIKEYNITDQDYLESLEGATEIRIYEVRVGKDGRAGISIQGTFPEGNIEMDVAGAELAALESTPEQPGIEVATEQVTPKQETKPLKVIGQKPGIVKIGDVVGKTVYYNGKPYVVEKEGVRYILNSDSTVIELAGDKNSSLESLGIDYYRGDFYSPEYTVVVNNENSVTVDGVNYIVKTDQKGNVIGLSPSNKPEQTIKNEKLLVAVEIERNKTVFINTNSNLDSVDTEEILDELEATDPMAHQKLMNVERVYNMNWNETVEAGLSNLYSKKPLTQSQRLAVDLWVTDAIVNMTKVYNKTSDPIYANALDNLEIINTLLYEGYTQKPQKTGVDESTKRTVKQTGQEGQRKQGKTVTEEAAVLLDSKALNKLGFTDLMLENMTEQEKTQASTFTTPEDASVFRESVVNRLRVLGFDVPYITEFTLYKDAQLVAKEAIGYRDEDGEYIIFVDTDDIVVVDSINTKTGEVVLQKLGSNDKVAYDINDLDEVLAFKDQIMEAKETPEETITNKKEAAEFTAEGNDLLNTFLDSKEGKERQAFIEQRTEDPDFTIDDIEGELLDDLTC
jgi:hypothetical protein